MVGKSIQLIKPPRFARPLPYAIIDLSSFVFVDEIETDKSKVAAAQADGGKLAGRRGGRSQGAERDDRIGEPEFFRSYRDTLGLIFARDQRGVRKDQMVRGEVDGSVDLLTTTSQGHIVNLKETGG